MGRHSARGMWDAAKHPHGEHGHWASTGGTGGKVVRRTSDRFAQAPDLGVVIRSPAAFRPPESAAKVRARKKRVSEAVEVPRGVRQPKSWAEEDRYLNWASPSKMAMQRALTGDTRMPRRAAIERAASMARRSGEKNPTTGVKRTFTGKKHRVRQHIPPHGTRMTTAARINLAWHGRD